LMMNNVTHEPLPRDAWLSAAMLATGIGVLTALIFGTWWFMEVSAHCGVVRFYEYLFGGLLFAGWLLVTAIGLKVAFVARRKRAKTVVIVGCGIAILANVGLVMVCIKVTYAFLAADFKFKSNQELVELLKNGDLEARIKAAHKLGERRVVEAVPLLSGLLENTNQDINLRHNAAIALGTICASPNRPGKDLDRASAALAIGLKEREGHLSTSIVEALGKIGDSRAIELLAQFIQDSSRSNFSRADAVRALGKIGDEQARAALKEARENCDNEEVRNSIDRVLKTMDNKQR